MIKGSARDWDGQVEMDSTCIEEGHVHMAGNWCSGGHGGWLSTVNTRRPKVAVLNMLQGRRSFTDRQGKGGKDIG